MNRLLIFVAALSCAAACPALAEQYWIAYEGDDFPENEGWTRVFCDPNGVVGQGGAVRTIEEGALVLDSLESIVIVDFYNMSRPIDPGPDELFLMRWRLSIDEIVSGPDPVAGVFSDGYEAVAFQLSDTSLRSTFEDRTISIDLLGCHEYELRSPDMATYELFVDDALAMAGVFSEVFEASRVGWGDGIQGGASVTRWDYFQFGVIPEPSAILGLPVMLVAIKRFSRYCAA